VLKEWLKELIAIPSPSGGEEALAAHLIGWARQQGFETHSEAGNVMVRLPGKDGARALILHAHMDVVPPGDPAHWETPPFAPDERNGRIYGSGASDDKGGIAVSMAVAAAYQGETPPLDLWLVWVVCEETDGSGSVAFAEWFQRLWRDRYAQVGALLFESTECRWLEYEAKGNVFLRILTEGGAGHGAMKRSLGTSAIARMVEAFPRLEAMEARWQEQGFGESTSLVTAVRAGEPSAPNRLDSGCEMVVDIRTTAGMHDRVVADVSRALEGVPHRLEVVGACPPGYTPPDSDFVRVFERALPGVEKTSSVASNDLFAFTAIDLPAFVFGPGSKEAIHRPNEYVELAHLAGCVGVVLEFLRLYASPQGP